MTEPKHIKQASEWMAAAGLNPDSEKGIYLTLINIAAYAQEGGSAEEQMLRNSYLFREKQKLGSNVLDVLTSTCPTFSTAIAHAQPI